MIVLYCVVCEECTEHEMLDGRVYPYECKNCGNRMDLKDDLSALEMAEACPGCSLHVKERIKSEEL